ncbi:MAG: crotonase/enoyl-CoA hydratase family protein [Solirubrobacteraceae bacterium]|nr:crotonase/enoyl-CoA hydratase family protein [Solirubrobacteraceae bacterium]
MSEDRVLVNVDGPIAEVTLNRGAKHNGLDRPMFDGITAAIEELKANNEIRAVVLHGDGPSFCAGLDFAGFDGDPTAILDRPNGKPANVAQQVSYGWIELPVPVIAAVHGNCFGGGLQIALGADVRFVTPDARLSVMEAKWGLIPDMGITAALPRLVGIDHALELTYTARIISGEEAERIGLCTHVSEDPLTAARALAEEIATRSPDAVRMTKRLFRDSWNMSAAEGLQLETDLQVQIMGKPNQMAAVMAGMTKQPAEFGEPIV